MKITSFAKTALTLLSLLAALSAGAADKATAKTTLTCDFPPAQAPQKVKPGQKNLSDGVIRIDAAKIRFKICNGCTWENSDGKWKVTADEYRLATANGINIAITRKTGEALFSLSSKEDEFYHASHVESRGQCKHG